MPRVPTGGRARLVAALTLVLAVVSVVGVTAWALDRDADPAPVAAQELRVAVAAEPDGTAVELEADLYLPDLPGQPRPSCSRTASAGPRTAWRARLRSW